MKQLKRMLRLLLVCVLVGGLLPMTAAAEDIKITAMEFTVENLALGEKGSAVKATVAADAPITLSGIASLRYDSAGEAGGLVKSDLLEKGQLYWLCINPVVKAGYSLTPYVMLQKESWTINGLPYGVAIDKVVQSGSQVRFRLTPLPEEIHSVELTGLRAPQLGQTVEEYYIALDKDMFNGTFKVNGFTMEGEWRFGNMKWHGGWLCDETKAEITDVSKQIDEGTYYLAEILVLTNGCVFAKDVTVTAADAAGVENQSDGEYLIVYTKYEVAVPYTITYDYESQEDVVIQFDKGISLYDASVTFAPPAETKAGYVFDQWVLSEDTSTDSLEEPENPSRTKIIGDVRFVPHWHKYYDEIHFEFSGYELGANISDGVLTDNIDGYAPQKMPDYWGGNNYVIVADKGGKPDMTDPTTILKVVTGKFEANTDYWLMVMIGGEGRDITGDIWLDAYGIDKYFLDSPECTDKWWYGEGEAECAFFKLKPLTNSAPTVNGVTRLAGENRLVTSQLIADQLNLQMGVEKFENIIVASGGTFADALPGSYLAAVKNAPILLTLAKDKYVTQTADYIKANLKDGGTVYILGGESAVPASMEKALSGLNVKRVAGKDRFGTNLEILKEAGVKPGDEILVCTAKEFADSLSAAATGKPILLVYKKITDEQKAYLATLSGNRFCVVGGTSAVPENLAEAMKAYGEVSRLAGKDRLDTSILVAKKYFPYARTSVVAYGWDFPDGLCGGSLAYATKSPLILAHSKEKLFKFTADYTVSAGLKAGFVLGGDKLVTDQATRAIFGMAADGAITVLK